MRPVATRASPSPKFRTFVEYEVRVWSVPCGQFPQAGRDCYRDHAGKFLDAGKAATNEDAPEILNSDSSSVPRKVAAIHGRVKFIVI